jgi:hypothetical protein
MRTPYSFTPDNPVAAPGGAGDGRGGGGVGGAAIWLIASLRPAIARVLVRCVPVLGAIVAVVVPVPVPEDGLNVIHGSLESAVHAHPLSVLTAKDTVPPAAGTLAGGWADRIGTGGSRPPVALADRPKC